MTVETALDVPTRTLAPDGKPVSKGLVLAWEAATFVFVMLVASALHFAYELSGFQWWVTNFGSVNESTFEHLKLFFWPMVFMTLVQHAYMRNRVNNFWWAKGLATLAAPLMLMVSFYFYLGISLPIYDRGFLWADIGTGVLGVLLGNFISYRLLTTDDLGKVRKWIGVAMIVIYGLMVLVFTHFPPRMFLFENFMRYTYSGEYGILEDYTPYLIFREA